MTISNLMKIAENSPKGLKTLWEKEKLLVMSVFKRPVLQTCKKQGFFEKKVNSLPHNPDFLMTLRQAF